MSHRLSLSLDAFGASALREHAERHSLSPAEFGSRAARYYLADRDSGRVALRVPRLPKSAGRKAALELTVDLDRESWQERQDVSVEAMLEHAIMYFLADIDSGRVEQRLLADLGRSAMTDDD